LIHFWYKQNSEIDSLHLMESIHNPVKTAFNWPCQNKKKLWICLHACSLSVPTILTASHRFIIAIHLFAVACCYRLQVFTKLKGQFNWNLQEQFDWRNCVKINWNWSLMGQVFTKFLWRSISKIWNATEEGHWNQTFYLFNWRNCVKILVG
jgi:hypothetical protein